MINRFRTFLGEGRFRTLLILLGATGTASFALGFSNSATAQTAQLVMALVFIGGAAWLIGGRMSAQHRIKWASILAPAFGLVLLGILFFPVYLLAFTGAAVGWVIVGSMIFGRVQSPMEYRQAVKFMRNSDYKSAVDVMDGLIKAEPEQANHYRFRAELLRLWGKLGRARRDYEKMIELEPESAVAHNGLAEVHLQAGAYPQALEAARKAYQLAPQEWVASYNLGMIEDRMGMAQAAVQSLAQAAQLKVPDARHRLLIYFYLARAHSRLNQLDAAQTAVDQMKDQGAGLKEWRQILESEQAETLRVVLQKDIHTAESLMNDTLTVADLGATQG